VKTVFGDLSGQKVDRVLVPLSAQDFTPYAQQLRQRNPDLVFVAWAGTTAGAMWTALDQQGVFDSVDTVVTGLAERATWPFYGPAGTKIKFLNHYNADAPKNKVNDWLKAKMKRRNQVPDLFTPDGFVAAQMIVRALKASTTDVEKMITALEGWSFTGPKGQQEIRASDHAMLQPMFLVQLRQSGGRYTAITNVRLRAKYTAPPAK
jgi:branched-chain amino acid transport system substrate-binding protein